LFQESVTFGTAGHVAVEGCYQVTNLKKIDYVSLQAVELKTQTSSWFCLAEALSNTRPYAVLFYAFPFISGLSK
jgi:hypothetical protein